MSDELVAWLVLRDECKKGVNERGIMPDYCDACLKLSAAAPRMLDRIEALTKRIEELEEGLRPFAREADNWLDKMDCEDLPADATDIKISDLRRARLLLQGMDK